VLEIGFYRERSYREGFRPECKRCSNRARAERARRRYEPRTGRRYLTRRDRQAAAARSTSRGWTRFTRLEFIERMYLLAGVALLLWTSVGGAVEEAEPAVRLASKTKGARLSLVRIGSYYWREMRKRLKLTAHFMRSHLPPPRLRMFRWLIAPQK